MSGARRLAILYATALLTTFANAAVLIAQDQAIPLDEPHFAAVSDGTETLGSEEMPAYWSLIKLVQDTPFDKLSTRIADSHQFDLLRTEPSRQRGAGSELTLTVRRVLAYPAPANNTGANLLYEVWGYNEQHPEELIVAVVPQLPATFVTGEQVAFRAIFRGVFFKLQGYRVASLSPGERFRTAPLFVGRIIAKPDVVTPMVTSADCWSLGAGGFLIASLTMACCYPWRRVSTTNRPSESAPQPSPAWDEWLYSCHSAESGDDHSNKGPSNDGR